MHWIGGKCQIHASSALNPGLRKKVAPTEQAAGWVPGLAWTFLGKGKTSCLCQGWIQSVALSLYLLCNPGSLVTVAMETLIIVWKKGCTRKSFAEQYAVRGQVILYLPKYKIIFFPNYHIKVRSHSILHEIQHILYKCFAAI